MIAKFERDNNQISETNQIQLDVNTQLAVNHIQSEIRNITEGFLGQPNNMDVCQVMSDQVFACLDGYHRRGVINNNYGVDADDDGNISLTFGVTGAGQRISIDVELD